MASLRAFGDGPQLAAIRADAARLGVALDAPGAVSADTVRDPRGFALKFYTEDGNYDLVGNNTPVFFIKDAVKFPDFIHTQKRDPYTGSQEADNVWDFWGLSPESTHQVTWLFGDRGIPASFRHMNGYGSHTYQWNNEATLLMKARTSKDYTDLDPLPSAFIGRRRSS